MQFTLVIFSTYEFFVESLASAKLAPPFFMKKKVLASKESNLLQFKINVLKKEFFFTSPQLKNTLFKNCLIAVNSYALLFAIQALIQLCCSMRKGNV
jgi:hypothetical protein